MKPFPNAQGSLEYLILAAGALMLAIILLTALASYLNQGTQSGNVRLANSQCAIYGSGTDCPSSGLATKHPLVAGVTYYCCWNASSNACFAQTTPVCS